MRVNTNKASTPVMYVLVGGLGLGLAYGVVRSFHMGLVAEICSLAVCVLIMWLIYRQGKASSYANAQSWAQAQVDIALEVTNQATAKANALSEAYSIAISQSNATAQNSVVFQVPQGYELPSVSSPSEVPIRQLDNPLIIPEDIVQSVTEGATDARRDGEGVRVAMGEQHSQKLTSVWKETDIQQGSHTPILNGE